VLYLFPQWAGDKSPFLASEITTSIRWQILMAPILALTGGLAAESVLAALQKGGEARAERIPTISSAAPMNHEPALRLADGKPRARARGQGKAQRPRGV
jgi:hypothetical protein